MSGEKLVQSPEEDMYENIHEVYLCPLCGSPMQHDCDLSIETGSLELFTICYWCGHTEFSDK